MLLTRTAYCHYTETYEIDITPEFLVELNEVLHKDYSESKDIIVTEKEIDQLYNGCDSEEEYNKSLLRTKIGTNPFGYTIDLESWLDDFLDLILWDYYVDNEYVDCYDQEIELIKY